MSQVKMPGTDRIADVGWLKANQWLLLRRLSQLSILGLFMLGPVAGIWVVKGNLASSLTLDTLALTDPYVLLQSLFAGHLIQTTAITGALIVLVFYLLVGGRVYCSWVCPINIVTDIANWLRRKFDIKGQGIRFNHQTGNWIFAMTLIMAFITGSIVWELVNPVSMIYRGLIFGIGSAWIMIIAIFLFDLFVSRRGWCSHLCPVGIFYGLIGSKSILRITTSNRDQCNDCMDCFTVCPEPQVIKPALKILADDKSPLIQSGRCTNCARCIDVCNQNVFSFTTRFNKQDGMHLHQQKEIMP
jgi:ferredoxin-type protein NapH